MLRTLVLIMCTYSVARADAVAYSCAGAPNVKVSRNSDGSCAGFSAHDAANREVSSGSLGFHGSGAFLATPDGHDIVFFEMNPMTVDAATDGLVFFHDGKVTARYKIRDLLVRPDLVTHSVSHVHWMRSSSPVVLGKTFALTTSSLRTYSFDVATGKQLTADDTDDWKRCDAIAYAGDRMHVVAGTGTIDQPAMAKGSVKGKLVFAIASGVALHDDTSGVTVCLAHRGAGWIAIGTIDVMYNGLPST